MGAKVLVGGKKKTAGSTSVGKLYKTTFIGINRYGSTLASVGNQIGSATEKLNKTNEKLESFEKKRKTLNDLKSGYLDLVTKNQEDIVSPKKPSRGPRKPGSDDDTKAVKKEGKGFLKAFGFLGKLLGGLKGFLGKAFFTAVLFSALKWFGDPANAKKVNNIVKGLKGVFGFIANVVKVVGGLVAGGIVNLGSGLEKIFGSGGNPKEILSGFGDLLQAIPGLFTIAWILKPGLMTKSVLKILNGFREPRERDPDDPKKKDPKKTDPKDKPKKPRRKSWLDKQRQRLEIQRKKLSKKFTQVTTQVGETVSASGQKRWSAFVTGAGKNWKKLTDAYNGTIGKLSSKFDELVDSQGKRLMGWLSEQKGVLGLIGKHLPDLFARLGKYLPFVGDVVGFVLDIMNGIDWRRALIRAIVGASIDAGFTSLMGALGLATPFTGGASAAAAIALYAAYMGADLAVGGLGKLVGDPISDALGIPMYAGEDPSAENVKPKVGSDADIKASTDAVASKDPDYLTKIAEKKGAKAEDGGILSPEGKKPLPFGAATTSENRDDIRDLIGIGPSFTNQTLRGLMKTAIRQQKILADTTYNMERQGIFEKGLNAVKNFVTGVASGAKRIVSDNLGHRNPFRTKAVAAPNDNAKALLDMLAHAEGADYNVMFTGKKFDNGFKDHPRQVQTSGSYSSDAAGRYQFLSTTWDELKGQIGAKDFSPANQDKAALLYIKQKGVDPNKPLTEKDIYRLGGAWASLEGGPKMVKGGSYGSQAKYSAEQALKLYKNYGGGKDLEEKASGGMIKNVPYVNQRALPNDSDGRAGDTQCYSATMSMLAQYFVGDKAKDYTQRRQKYGNSIYDSAQIPTLKEYGITGRRVTGATAKDVKSQLDKGTPTPLGLTYRGGNSSGHWALAVGYDDKGFIISDPFGQMGKNDFVKVNSASPLNDGVGRYYRMSNEVYAVQNPEGNGHYWKIDNVNPDAAKESTSSISDASLSGAGTTQTVRKAAQTPEQIFAQLSEAIAKYKSAIGGTSTTTTPSDQNAKTPESMNSIGPVADGDAYAKALSNTQHGEGAEKKSIGGSLKGFSSGGEFNLTPTVNALSRSSQAFSLIPTVFDVPPEMVSTMNQTSSQLSGEANRVQSIQASISNVQLNQTSNLLDQSRVVVAEKKSRRATPIVINNTRQVRQQVMSGTRSFAVPTPTKHTKFF